MSRPRRRKKIVNPNAPKNPQGEAPVPARPKAVPAKPTAAKPKAVPAKPQAVPAKPAAVPAKPTAVPAKPAAARPKAVPAKPRAAPARPKAAPAKSPAVPAKPKAAPARPKAAPRKAATPTTADAARPARAAESAAAGGTGKDATRRRSAGGTRGEDPYIGKTIARCRILERIGLGKTAAVYRAHHEALDTEVAVKILRESARAHPELIERFESEAKVIAQLDNENIVKIYDVGHEGTTHYLVMELLDGTEILDVITDEGPFEPMDALRVIRQAANGLAAAHDRGIIHRDVKPQNLLLLEDGTVKVLDFGLAASSDEAGQRVGTPHYMAPEICRDGKGDLGSDVYALGIVLFHLLTGQPPYAGHSINEILRKHIAGEPLRPERERLDLPPKVAELVRTLTKNDPLLRPSATEVVEQLDGIGGEALLEKGSLKGRRTGRRRALAAARRSRSTAAPLMVGVGLLVVVGIVALVMSSGGSDEPGGGTTVAGTPGGGSGTPASASTSGTSGAPGGTVVPAPGPRAETDAERETREALEKAELERKRSEEADRALTRAHAKARATWHTRDDTPFVIEIYRDVANRYKALPAGKQAIEIVKEIKAQKRHPHPDRSYSDAQSIAEARRTWEESRAQVQKDIVAYEYDEAAKRVPAVVNDADGDLARKLEFWHTHLGLLRDLRRELVKAVEAMEKSDRVVRTPDGTMPIVAVKHKGIEVTIDGEKKLYTWAEIGAESTGELALSAFEGKGAKGLVMQMALAFAHDIDGHFWDREFDLSMAKDAATYARIIKEYKSRKDG